MIKEIGWYIDDNRFSDIVEEFNNIVEKIQISSSQSNANETVAYKQQLADMLQWHVENSGLDLQDTAYSYIEQNIFPDGVFNQKKLDDLEKDIIKAHMYQKHLWDYMGTMSMYTPISKRAMERDGYDYDSFVPISFKKEHSDKSPIDNIIEKEKNSVPIYVYSDGSVSPKFDKKKARLQFNSLKDTSGFDWDKKGWDPNYELEKEWQGTFSKTGEWVQISGDIPNLNKKKTMPVVDLDSKHSIQIIKDVDGNGILYDPYYEFMFMYLATKYIEDEFTKANNDELIAMTLGSVKNAMDSLGIKKISSVVKNPYSDKMLDDDRNTIPKFATILEDDVKVSQMYKHILGDIVLDNVGFKTINEARDIEEKSVDEYKNSIIKEKGEELSAKIDFIISSGITGEEATEAIFSNVATMNLNYKVDSDLAYVGLNDEDIMLLNNYEIPLDKQEIFNKVLFNVIINYDYVNTNNYSRNQLFDDIYDNVVLSKKTGREVDFETNFDTMIRNFVKPIILPDMSDELRNEFKNLKDELLSEFPPNIKAKAKVYLDNAEESYTLIKRNNANSTPYDVLNKALALFKKDNRIQDVGIVYKSFASRKVENDIVRYYDTIKIDDVIQENMNYDFKKRVRDFSFEFDEYSRHNNNKVNLFNKNNEEEFFNSAKFKSSLMSQDVLSEIIENEKIDINKNLDTESYKNLKLIKNIDLPDTYIGSDLYGLGKDLTNEDTDYISNLFGKGFVGSDLVNQGILFYTYVFNGAKSQIENEEISKRSARAAEVSQYDTPKRRKVSLSNDEVLSEEYDFNSGKINVYDRTSTDDGKGFFVNKNGESFEIVNTFARDYKYKVPAQILVGIKDKFSSSKLNYIDIVRKRKPSTTVSLQSDDVELTVSEDRILEEWAINNGFVYRNTRTGQIIYDKDLALYGFSKLNPNVSFSSFIASKDSAISKVNISSQDHKPKFSTYPKFNQRNEDSSKENSKVKFGGEKQPFVEEKKIQKKKAVIKDKEEIESNQFVQKYVEDAKKINEEIKNDLLKSSEESRIKEQAQAVGDMLSSDIISTLSNRMLK